MMLKLTLILGLLACLTPCHAAVDVLHYDLQLTFRSMTSGELEGVCGVHFRYTHPKSEVLKLELLSYKVESVTLWGKPVSFEYEEPELHLKLPPLPPTADTATVYVKYSGRPATPSWFGGVSFSEDYIYNLACSIEAVPHNYGKSLFPCVDNFTDKATYRFEVRAPAGKMAVCNGSLIETKAHKDGSHTYIWKLRDPISTYLVGVAVSDYRAWNDTWKGRRGEIPITIYAPPDRLAHVAGSFKRLKQCLTHFEHCFGPYEWERVGYVAVPMKGGAMEHATNIAYPHLFIDGTTNEERLWAHELAHSWFGNLVTCASGGDMWLNEGFARWSEALFVQEAYGDSAYRRKMADVQSKVLRGSHIQDKGYYAVAGVPDDITYGSTVYDKGALVAHNLRFHLGDAVFFAAIQQYLQTLKFGNATTQQFCDSMSRYAQTNLRPFFEGWVFSKGHYHINLDSMSVKQADGNYTALLHIQQKRIFKDWCCPNTRVNVLFFGPNGERFQQRFALRGEFTAQSVPLPFNPVGAVLDPEQEILDASVDVFGSYGAAGLFLCPNTDWTFDMRAVRDSAHLQVSYHFTPAEIPDPAGNKLAAQRYWSVNGYWPEGFEAEATLRYYRKALFPDALNDVFRVTNKHPQLAVYHRQNAGTPWKQLTTAELKEDGEVRFKAVGTGEYGLFLVPNKE